MVQFAPLGCVVDHTPRPIIVPEQDKPVLSGFPLCPGSHSRARICHRDVRLRRHRLHGAWSGRLTSRYRGGRGASAIVS